MRFYHILALAIASTVMASPAAIAEDVDVDVRSTDSDVAEAFESRVSPPWAFSVVKTTAFVGSNTKSHVRRTNACTVTARPPRIVARGWRATQRVHLVFTDNIY